MNMKFIEAREHIAKAREALRRSDKESARQLGEKAALLAPDMEDAWLVLTASDANPRDALAYARKALEINPQSARARQGVEWASGRLKQAEGGSGRNEAVVASPPKRVYREAIASPALRVNGRNWLYPILLIGAACMVIGFVVLFALTSPALASIVNNVGAPALAQEQLWAPVNIAKPEVTPIDVGAFAPQAADTPAAAPSDVPAALPTQEPTSAPTDEPTSIPTEAPTLTLEATETPGTMAMDIIVDTPTSQYVAPAPAAEGLAYPAKGNGARWIDVNLSEQRVYAYEGDVVVNSFIVSTGTARTPTVTGKFKIWIKLKSTTMSGPGYYLTNVPYAMYFHKGYGLHGTYWHNNFGTPMSHGCVNLSIPDAAWLYGWAYEGTVVKVHY